MEGKPKAEDRMNMVNVVTVGVVGVLLVWVSIVALQAYYKSTLDKAEQERLVAGQTVDLTKVRAAEGALINGYSARMSGTAQKKVMVIPVQDAMKKVVDELKADPAASVVPEIGPQTKATRHPYPPFGAIKDEAPATPAPTDGATPAPTDGATPAPAGGATPPVAPAGGGTPQ